MTLSTTQTKLIGLISKKTGLKPEEYLLQLLLKEYRRSFNKDYQV